jgi:hypothetical protein
MKSLQTLSFLVVMLCAAFASAQSQWQRLTNSPPENVGAILLLTDGTVLGHQEDDTIQSLATPKWYKLTPDINGSYFNGTWSEIASLPSIYCPLYFASAVLQDARLIVFGGEDNTCGMNNLGYIYDPVADTWTRVGPPMGSTWAYIGDVPSAILNDGTFMLASWTASGDALLNIPNLTWTPTGTGKFDSNEEEGWTLLTNGKVLTVDGYIGHYNATGMNSEIYDPNTGMWTSAGSTGVQLWDSAANCGGRGKATNEVGPAMLMANGTVFATGANSCGAGHTSIYNVSAGTWTPGPDFPSNLDIADGPAALEPNGKVLTIASPGIFMPPATFFEWDGSNLTQIGGPLNNDIGNTSYKGHLLVLPNGQVLYTRFSRDVEIFTPIPGTYNWVPSAFLTSNSFSRGSSFVLYGNKLNGLSQAAAYGDDYQAATNYPLVRITNVATGHVFYCRTHDHSTMAIGNPGLVSTHVDIPANAETGLSYLEVIANGIASRKYNVTIH